ncbi:class I SAM-dependent methyltransferase [Candidatus Bipolaricaulota bacterium]|nr:class I SAM-dependent methyltransferase [Candidatus Bipolaricaulota bacterium]
MNDQSEKPLQERFYLYERQLVTLDDFPSSGHILDIGGGGEGIIGLLKSQDVIAIDINRRELEGAAEGALKIVMDAGDLQFLDDAFNTVTAFFSLMYLKESSDHRKVFDEAFRVLRPGGRFLIWDTNISERPDVPQPNYAVLLTVRVKDHEIETGYGQPWPKEAHDLSFYETLAQETAFQIEDRETEGHVFFLRLQKP